jgi:hypothetical protein
MGWPVGRRGVFVWDLVLVAVAVVESSSWEVWAGVEVEAEGDAEVVRGEVVGGEVVGGEVVGGEVELDATAWAWRSGR